MPQISYDIIIFIIVVVLLLLGMLSFIIRIVLLYQKRQHFFQQELVRTGVNYEHNLMRAKLEVQEKALHHIACEIHDNINLSLTLAKLHLNTLNIDNKEELETKTKTSIDLLSKCILELNNLSRGMNSDVIDKYGLLKVLDIELEHIRQAATFKINFITEGEPVFLDKKQELLIFRMIQEGFNNVIKHAKATEVDFKLHFLSKLLIVILNDNGIGFDFEIKKANNESGILNMQTRAKMAGGEMHLSSAPDEGTSLIFIIPYKAI